MTQEQISDINSIKKTYKKSLLRWYKLILMFFILTKVLFHPGYFVDFYISFLTSIVLAVVILILFITCVPDMLSKEVIAMYNQSNIDNETSFLVNRDSFLGPNFGVLEIGDTITFTPLRLILMNESFDITPDGLHNTNISYLMSRKSSIGIIIKLNNKKYKLKINNLNKAYKLFESRISDSSI